MPGIPKPKTSFVLLGPYPPPYGGVAIFNQNLFEATKENGEPEMWTHTKHLKRTDKVKYYKPDFINTFRFLLANGSKKTILDSSIFSAEYPEVGVVLAWVILKPFLRFHWIKVYHDGSLPSRYHSFTFLQKLAIRLSVASYDQALPVSQDLFSWLNKTFLLKNKIRQISSLLPIPDKIIKSRKSSVLKNDFPPDIKLVCSMGAFIPNYGFKQIADAVNMIRIQKNQNIGLILIAGGFKEDLIYKEQTLKNRDWIIVFHDIPHQEAINIIRASDVLVRATEEESYGLCKVEALLCETPVLATSTGETRGMFLYNLFDNQQMTDQLIEILKNGKSPDHQKFIEMYQAEAKQNLQSILTALKAFQ